MTTSRSSFRPIVLKSNLSPRATIAGDVAGLFSPQLAELGLRVEATVRPRVEKKMVHAGACSMSFEQGQKVA